MFDGLENESDFVGKKGEVIEISAKPKPHFLYQTKNKSI